MSKRNVQSADGSNDNVSKVVKKKHIIPAQSEVPKMLTYQQVAKILAIDKRSVYNLVKYEGLPVVRLRPRLPLIDEADLRAWLEERKKVR